METDAAFQVLLWAVGIQTSVTIAGAVFLLRRLAALVDAVGLLAQRVANLEGRHAVHPWGAPPPG